MLLYKIKLQKFICPKANNKYIKIGSDSNFYFDIMRPFYEISTFRLTCMNFMSSVYDKTVQTLSPRAATFHDWGRGTQYKS